jgi:hypothetical protein
VPKKNKEDLPSAFAAYVDGRKIPQFRDSSVLFWDVLGVRNFSLSTDALSHLKRLSAALSRARKRTGFEPPRGEPWHAVTWFTDNLVVGTPVSSDDEVEAALGSTAIGAAYLQLLLLDAGFLGRGGIAYGPHHMQKRLVFGPALVEAVNLEKDTRWPRVALTKKAADLNRKAVRDFYSNPEDSPHADEYLVDDEDDVVFVDPLSLWLAEEDDDELVDDILSRQRRTIECALSRETGGVFDKWKWLADMHNHALSQIPDFTRFQIDAGKPQHSFRPFISTL